MVGSIPGLDVEATLPEPLAQQFIAAATTVRVRKGQLLIVQGSAADEVYLIQSGQVRISVFSPNGRETYLRDMGPGRLLGELAAITGESRSATAAAREAMQLAVMPAAAFRRFLHDVPGAGFWLAMQLAARVRHLTEKSAELANLPVAARLVSELLRLAAAAPAAGDACRIADFPTHAELAARIGSHREAITRELRQLAADGLAVQTGRHFDILSLPRLRRLLDQLSQ